MATSVARYVTPEEYLERERKAETKSEYRQGKIFAIPGGTTNDALIAVNFSGELRQALKRAAL